MIARILAIYIIASAVALALAWALLAIAGEPKAPEAREARHD
jgi:hypothetical protein